MLSFVLRVFNRLSYCKEWITTPFLICILIFLSSVNAREIVWAVNCGGEEHIDSHGVHYEADPLDVGVSSDYGTGLFIQNVDPRDQILYQTERYHTNTFGYDLPVHQDGDYVLVLKFSEVWFEAPNQKVFDVVLNGEHTIVSELDIFSKVGRGVGHDEIIPFTIKNGKLKVNDETSQIDGSKISLEFIKGELDNPKINAIYLMKGTVDEVPKLPSVPVHDTSEEVDDDDDENKEDIGQTPNLKPQKIHKSSGPKTKDPYASEDTSTMLLPVFVALGAFIPLAYCLCKLL